MSRLPKLLLLPLVLGAVSMLPSPGMALAAPEKDRAALLEFTGRGAMTRFLPRLFLP